MKATISEEPAVYTIDVDGRKLRGLRVAGDLGPVRMLKDDKGEQVFILRHDQEGTFARLFGDITRPEGSPADVTVIAATPGLLDRIRRWPGAD
jgi:hypothetical protein